MPRIPSDSPQVAPPAATGGAGSRFEGKVGAFYLLGLLASSEPRGLAGAAFRSVRFQQVPEGYALDDIVVEATSADGSPATLEIQAKRTLDFTASDTVFADVVARMWEAAQKSAFNATRYELAVAISRTSTRIERSCQEALQWARLLPDGRTFAARIGREGLSSKGMREFVAVFRDNLAAAGAPTDDETVWALLRRFQILVFDFDAPGSDYEHRARERTRLVLTPGHAGRSGELWPALIEQAGALAAVGGSVDHATLAEELKTIYGFTFDARADLRRVYARLSESSELTLDDIKDHVGGVRLPRSELVEQAHAALEQVRMIRLVGGSGVGKSMVMKQIARRLEPEGAIIVLRPGRIVPGGWPRMAHEIECTVTRDELFNELGCGGGATLFIDNIDQIDDAGEWATVGDLPRGVAKNPGWRAVATARHDSNEWMLKLPETLRDAESTAVPVPEISDAEATVLSRENEAFSLLLGGDHPARGIARNLFFLSRMVELGGGQGITTELDLARLWWRYGGGRAEDPGKWPRLNVLRAMAHQIVAHPGRVAFRADDFNHHEAIVELLRFDSLREDVRGSTIAFQHDVLRDWTTGFLLHEEADFLTGIPKAKPLPAGLARGLEIAARLALESDTTGAKWIELLAAVERDGCHGSWKRPVLLAVPRSEQALVLFERLAPFLLQEDGRRLGEIIRLMIAVESEPLVKAVARLQPAIAIPDGAGDIVVPRGLGWMWLVFWVVNCAHPLPTALIPELSKLFQSWLISTQAQSLSINARVVELLFEWLALVEDAMQPRMYRGIEDVPPSLNIPHVRDVRNGILMTAFSFSHLNPSAADHYLRALDPNAVRHHDLELIFRFPGTLTRAAPTALVDFILACLIEEDDPDDPYRNRGVRFGPFGVNSHFFSPESPGQGPFFELLEHAPAEGLRLVRSVVEHATAWRRSMYSAGEPFPRLAIAFPVGARSFHGDFAVYHWARSCPQCTIVGSALMALEAWGHRQVDAGRAFDEVLYDVLGPDGSSVAFVAVAADLVLSHWDRAREFAWPMVATPELLVLDDIRATRDAAGVDRRLAVEQEPAAWRVKRANLEERFSRRTRLLDSIYWYVFHGSPERLAVLREALENARNRIVLSGISDGDPIKGLLATAERAVRMTAAEHWPLQTLRRDDGSEVQYRQYRFEEQEQARIDAESERVDARLRHDSLRAQVQTALFNPARSTAEVVAESIRWAREQSESAGPPPEDIESEEFSRQWDRRAVIMAAALAARDYMGPDANVLVWARTVLHRAATQQDKEYLGNDQIQYNATAIAALGLVALYRKEANAETRDMLMRLATYQHGAVLNALGSHFPELLRSDPRLVPSLIRIVMTSAAYPRRGDNEEQNQAAYLERVEAAIAAERNWLAGNSAEPAWPELTKWLSRPRHGIRIGGPTVDHDAECEEAIPELLPDEHTLGALASHLIRLTVGERPAWLVPLAEHLLAWTTEANGPHGEQDRERDHLPYTWNSHFFEFLGILSVALPHDEVAKRFLEPLARFKDEPFHDGMAEFVRGFDRATLATDTRNPENPAGVRALLAGRIRRGWNFKRLGREKSFTSETHAGDALNAMFYQPHRVQNDGRPQIPNNWDGLTATMPILTTLVVEAPTSGYLAGLFLNVVESSPRAALLPFVVRALEAWCVGYGIDPNFWSEKDIGSRVCAWIIRALDGEAVAPRELVSAQEELLRCLDTLIRSGVAQAREVEDRISSAEIGRKSA